MSRAKRSGGAIGVACLFGVGASSWWIGSWGLATQAIASPSVWPVAPAASAPVASAPAVSGHVVSAPVASGPSAPAGVASVRSPAAIAQIANRLAKALRGSLPLPARVVAASLRSDEAAPRGGELVAKVAALVAAAIDTAAREPREPPASAPRMAGGKGGAVVELEVTIQRGALEVAAALSRQPANIWDQAKALARAPVPHASASAPIDAEVRAYLTPITQLASHSDVVSLDDRDVVALACADLDGDGSLEIATIGRRRIAIGRVRGKRFVVDRSRPWADLSPVAAAPMREPLAAAAFITDPSGVPRLDVTLSDRARAVRLDATLSAVATLDQWPVGEPLGAPHGATLPTGTDVLAMARVVSQQGSSRTVRATRAPSGQLDLATDGATSSWAGAGAELAVVDLDQDGDPEIVTTLDVLAPAADALVVLSWHPGAAPRERTRVAVPGGIRALAVCPPDASGAPAIVLATATAELWIVR